MKTLLHIIDSLPLGGAERLLVDIINSLPNYRHHVIIQHGPEKLRPQLPDNCVFLNLNRKNYWELYKKSREIRKYIKANKIDLVHSHLFFSNVLARLATPRRIPLVNSLHVVSSLDNYTKSKLALHLEKLTYRKRHHILAVSKIVLDDFDKWVGVKGQSTVLYNFINDLYFGHLPKTTFSVKPFRLVAVGNLRYQKNYPYLIEAFKKMPAHVTLDIYGDGSLKEALQADIDKYNLNIQLQGTRPDLYKVLPDYDAFIMSSFFEGQPLGLLEAIACGLPAILSDIKELREVTKEFAVYFDLHDPMDLVNKMNAILDNTINIASNTEPALNFINTFARKEIYLSNLQKLYAEKLH